MNQVKFNARHVAANGLKARVHYSLDSRNDGLSLGEENAIEEGMEEALRDKFDSGVDIEWMSEQLGERQVELAPILLALFLNKGDGVDQRQAFELAFEQMRADYVAASMNDDDLRAEVTAEVTGSYK